MQKTLNGINISQGSESSSTAMDIETKEEPIPEWNGENLFLQFPHNISHTCGLRNLGNTCYMNSVVQALAYVPPLTAFLISDWTSVTSPGAGVPPRSDSAKSRRKFSRELAETVRILWSGKFRDYVSRPLMSALIDTVPEFRMHGQQDAEEALTYALNNLHDDLFVPVPTELHPAYSILNKLEKERKKLEVDARVRGVRKEEPDEATRKKKEEEARIPQAYEPYKRSVVSDTFQSLLAQRVTCSRCECTSLTVQECFNLPLELPSKSQTKGLHGDSGGRGVSKSTVGGAGLKQVPSNASLEQMQSSPKGAQVKQSALPSGDSDSGSGGSGILSSVWSSLKSAMSLSGHSLELEQCLRSFFSPETLKGEEQYYCDNCKSKEDASKTHELVHLPEVLCLQLKRFKKSRGTFGLGSAKNSTTVRYPVEGLDLSAFCSPDCAEASSSAVYDLIGVVRHSGGDNSGHYIATCKSLVQGKWYEFDDEFVTQVGSLEQLQSNDAYLLFYSRRPTKQEHDRKEKAKRILRTQANTTAIGIVNSGASATNGTTSSVSSRVYVSKYWAMKFETMGRPGPVDNWAFTCEHGGVAMPATKDVKDRVASISAGALVEIEKLYHGSFPAAKVASLHACVQCRETFEVLESRRATELEECSELFKLPHGDVYYFVPRNWFQKWLNFVHNDCGPLGRGPWTGCTQPGSMDTCSMMTTDATTKQPVLKEKLRVDLNYIVVNRQVFRFWEKVYGVSGPVLCRASKDLYTAPIPDVDPPALASVPSAIPSASSSPISVNDEGDVHNGHRQGGMEVEQQPEDGVPDY